MTVSKKYAGLVGTVVGRLQIEEYVPGSKVNKIQPMFRCHCSCGRRDYTALAKNVARAKEGYNIGCGCLQRNGFVAAIAARRTHGMTNIPEYRVWASMIRRCHSVSDCGYRYYGARGVRVCDAWRTSFSAFIADMGRRPGKEYTIERKNVNGDYEPANCIWLLASQQSANRRNTVSLLAFGRRQTQRRWAIELGISQWSIRNARRSGVSLEDLCRRLGVTPNEPDSRLSTPPVESSS